MADFIGEANFLKAKVLKVQGEKGEEAQIQVAGQQLLVNDHVGIKEGEEASLVIRPEAAVLSDKGHLEGVVTLSTFMGAYQYYQPKWNTQRQR